MKYILTFESFVYEKNAVQAAEDQLKKTISRSQNYDNKAAAIDYEIEFRKDKLDYEKKKDQLQQQIKDESDPVKKEQEKERLKTFRDKWKEEKETYKSRLKAMRY
jgi:uncharacterized membrane protein YkoI